MHNLLMAVVKSVEVGFAVTSQEIKKESYFEVKLRKGVELDEGSIREIASKISPKYQGGIFFEGGVTLVFEKWGASNANFLGIVVEKEGVIRNQTLGIVKSALVGHPAVTHYDVTYAIPDDAMRRKLEKAAEEMESFRMEVVKSEPSFGKMKLKLDGDAWVGEMREGWSVRKLRVSKEDEHIKLRVEVKKRSSMTDVEYIFLNRRLIGIEVNQPEWAEGVRIDPREVKRNIGELVKKGETKKLAVGEGINILEVKEKVKSKAGEVVARYSLTERGTLMRLDLIDRDGEPLVMRPNKIRKQMGEFLAEELVQEWVGKEKPEILR